MRNFVSIILPLIIIGVVSVLLIVSFIVQKRKNAKQKVDFLAYGMGCGICLGAAVGIILIPSFGSIAISFGLSYGTLFGIVIGVIPGIFKKKK